MDDGAERLIEILAGRGQLSLRAYLAAIVGPQRLAMAPRTVKELTPDNTTQLYKNLGASDAYALIGVALPFNAPTNPLTVVFSKDDKIGFNSGLPFLLTDNQNSFAFTQLILPGEELYGQIMGAPILAQNVVVSAVLF